MDFNKSINNDKGNENAGPGPLVTSMEATDEINDVQAPPPQIETSITAANGLLTNGSS